MAPCYSDFEEEPEPLGAMPNTALNPTMLAVQIHVQFPLKAQLLLMV